LDDISSGEWPNIADVVLDGKYWVDALLGQGGMGAVYRATHLGTTRTVAVKIIHPRFSQDPEFVERFRREAAASGRLRHPNVVDVTDFGFAATQIGQVAYLVMEYVAGRSLADVLASEDRLSMGWVVDILEQVCSAVADAHRLGIVHRDLKPDNIWLEPNRRGGFTVKVLDFGLAKLAGLEAPAVAIKPTSGPEDMTGAFLAADSGLVTQAGAVTGTPLYMSPEQCRGDEVDARSDIYSLGVVAYRMLAGAPTFSGEAMHLIKQHCETPPPNLADRVARVPRRLSAVVMSALAKNPADRPGSAAGFGSALRASAEGSGALLRHAVSLSSEHFPVFFKMAVLASVPLIIMAAILVAIDRDRGGETSSPAAILIFLSMISCNVFAYAAVAGGSVPLVVQLTAAPLRQVQIGTALDALKRRVVLFTGSTVALLLMTLVASVLFVLLGIALAFWHILYAPVVAMERLSFAGTLRRARRLLGRVWSTAVVIALLQFALPLLVWILSIDSHFVLRFDEHWRPQEMGFTFGMSAGSMLFQLLNIVVTPLTALMTAQLYLKARHAGGEATGTP
jgi:tRNA A-37 threonylcarbamoyl transferase component Bud32